MKLNKFMIAAVALGFASIANAAPAVDQGHGKITFTGSIIDAPCSIAPESIDQTVELGQISKAALQNGGQSTPKNFSIKLEGCSFGDPATKNKVQIAFTGMESMAANGLLGIYGNAMGASVAITDASGSLITFDGVPGNIQPLQGQNNSLNFAAYLQGDGDTVEVVEGDFQAVADFTLSYS
ncbi:fimbrial protein [Serratia sp. NPDC078593]|uniref:fimbrial protein n=1 Tax=unclassified Serratia (in: enterobacteria) TaxID=2647522 RepID=UPI0037D7A18A